MSESPSTKSMVRDAEGDADAPAAPPPLLGRAFVADPDADLAACRSLLRTGSRTFHAASFALPRRVREPAAALYAFCRLADDAIDGCGAGDADAALEQLYARLDAAYSGRPQAHAVDRAFAEVVRTFAVPRALPLALLEGFAWDATGRRYATLADLEAYAARVAGAVGAMMAVLMGVRDPRLLARACDLGVAMQYTNIARDVGEDARAGRVYLPTDWLQAVGIDADGLLSRPDYSAPLGEVVRRLLAAAEPLYMRSVAGIAGLPRGCRPGMHAARLLYAEIGAEVARRGFDSVASRAVVPRSRKSVLLASALAASLADAPRAGADLDAPPLAATRWLVEAVAAAPMPAVPIALGFAEGIAWMLDLFARLERSDR